MTITQDDEEFLQVSLRHLAIMQGAQVDGEAFYPYGWFDLPDYALADFGTMAWLASMSPYHMNRPMAQVLSNFDMPLRLSQYRILRSNGYPRACFTWAGLSPDAERQFGVDQVPLQKDQWNGGTSIWVVDLLAPFGQLDQVIKIMAANRQTNRVRTLWHNKAGTRARIIEWTRTSPNGKISVKSYGPAQFATHLAEGR